MTQEPIAIERHGAVAVMMLDRPAAGNAVDMAMASAFAAAATALAADASVRCVVLTGAGKLFCGGGDVAAMGAAKEGPSPFLHRLATTLHGGVATLAAMAKPLVVLVNGPAAGAGLSLAIAGDVVLAGRSAHFTAAYGSVGLTPDGGMSWLLPRLVGLRRAQEIILTNRRIGAEEAQAIGLVTRVVDDAALREEGMAVAERLAAGPVAAIGGARALLAAGYDHDLPAQLALEADRIAEAGAGPEAREGVAAFAERRKPDFTRNDA